MRCPTEWEETSRFLHSDLDIEEKDAPEWLQYRFEDWAEEESAQTGLHLDDDRPELWERFKEEHTK